MLYKYRLPIQKATAGVHEPVSFTVDVFNLKEHPFKSPEAESSDVFRHVTKRYIDN